MATRRRYKDGGRVPSDDIAGAEHEPLPAPADPVAVETSGHPVPDDDAVMRAVERQRHAEELSQAARKPVHADAPQDVPRDFEERISQFPDRAKTWLREHPEFINDAAKTEEIGAAHTYIVNRKKLEPFSQAYFDALDNEFGYSRASAPSAPQAPAREPLTVQRKSIPVSAPVSREVPMSNGRREPTQVTLTADERQIANVSFRHLATEAERAFAYDQNKRKMLGMKARGEIQGDGGQ